jgi:DNA-binding HxlR family transcriptional regulator
MIMVTRHGAKKFITAVLPEIKNRLDAGYTIKEIHADLPDLANNISYSATLRNLQKMGISERTSHQGKTPKIESQKNEGLSELQKEQPYAERNLEKLKNKKPGFAYDPHTNGKDFI